MTMAREIPLDEIGDFYRASIDALARATTLEATKRLKEKTPVRVVYPGEPKGGGDLRNGWIPDTDNYEVTNRVEYAEPVVYGTNLPRSWKGEYRTRQNTVPGFPDLIAKELESWVKREYNKIANR